MSPPRAKSTVTERLGRWFQVAQAWQPCFSSDGQEVLFLSDASGLPQAWRTDARGEQIRRLLETRDRIGRVDACPTVRRAVVSQDSGGNEVWQLELITLREGIGTPRERRRPLTADPNVMNLPGRWMMDGHQYLFSSNARNRRYFDVYRVNVDGWSPPERIWTGDAWQEAVATRADRILVQRYNTGLDSDLFLLGPAGAPVHLNPHEGELTVSSAAIGVDAVYVATNPGREYVGLLRYPFEGTDPTVVQEYDGDVELVRISPRGSRLAVVVNRDGWSDLHIVDTESNADRLVRLRPRGMIEEAVWHPNGSAVAFDLSWTNGREIFVYDLESRRSRRLTVSAVSPPRRISEPRLGSVKSVDGLRLPYWEYVGPGGGRRGTLISIHGGPEAQARPSFDPALGFLVGEGWRVVLPNVRGSLGYGRTYVHLDDVRKRMDSVRDIRDIAEGLTRSKKAVRGRIGIIGGSYGGFMVLASITTYPEYWGAAVEIFGISNFVTFLERTADYRRALREAEYGRLDRDREFLESISPIHHLDRIRTPLLVLHGRNDPRVPILEAEQIVEALGKSGRHVESLFFENEGHGFTRRENQIETARRAVEFFDRHLATASDSRAGARHRRHSVES